VKRSQLISFITILVIAFGGLLGSLAAGWSPGLGLDLQGGASVVLQPDRKVDSKVLDQTIGIIRSRVNALGVAESEVSRQGDAIVVQLPGVKDQKRALSIVGQTAELRFRPVVGDIPSEDDLKASASTGKDATTVKTITVTSTPGAAAAATTVAPGAASATATTSAPTTAAPTTAAPAIEVAPAGGFGSFALRAAAATSTAAPTTAAPTTAAPTTVPPTTVPSSTVGPTTTSATGTAVTTTGVPATIDPSLSKLETTPPDKDEATSTVILPIDKVSSKSARLLLGPTQLTGEVVSNAAASYQNNEWVVDVEFNSKGSALWDQMANENYGKRVAIVLDGVVKSAPSINARVFNGRAQISGSFDQNSASDLATVLRFGSLPVQLKPQTVQTVSATLGRDSLHAGLLAGAIGIALVCAYMILYYRALGLVVVLGLTVSGAIMWGLMSLLTETQGLALTLSGVVGIIVSVGITVDSYVVYFEKIRDEIRNGRKLEVAVQKGFKSAWRTILSADLTSLIGATVLFVLTVGGVRGFAYFLAISTVLDMTVAYFFTRPLVGLLSRTNFFRSGPLKIDLSETSARVAPQAATRITPGMAKSGTSTSATSGATKEV
jgi:preprotein translocase subunit SecD